MIFFVLRIACAGDWRSFVFLLLALECFGFGFPWVWGFSVNFGIFGFWVLCWAHDGSLGFELHRVHSSSKS